MKGSHRIMGDTAKGCSRGSILNSDSHRLPDANDQCQAQTQCSERTEEGKHAQQKALHLGVLFSKERKPKC